MKISIKGALYMLVSWLFIAVCVYFAVTNKTKQAEPTDNGLVQFENADSLERAECAEPIN